MDQDEYYIDSCPIFKLCYSYRETIDEALENIREVIDIGLKETKPEDIKFIEFGERSNPE